MGDIGRVALFVALLFAALAAFAGLGVVVLAQALSGTAVVNPTATLLSVLTLSGVGAALGLGYGAVAGLVVALARRIPVPGRRPLAAAVVFGAGISGIAERVLALALGDAALPRFDVGTTLAIRAVLAALVALIAWQEIRQRDPGTMPTLGQAGRSLRR